MDADYSVPMFGQVTINWSAGMDEDGTVQGYIGVPDVPGELLESDGVVLQFQEPLVHYGDEALLRGVQITMTQALRLEVLPQIIPTMVKALMELRERAGGYQPVENKAEEA